jgi:hypothetical protein
VLFARGHLASNLALLLGQIKLGSRGNRENAAQIGGLKERPLM